MVKLQAPTRGDTVGAERVSVGLAQMYPISSLDVAFSQEKSTANTMQTSGRGGRRCLYVYVTQSAE